MSPSGQSLNTDHFPSHDPSTKSKADNLARTRRNQQRCRERKRVYVTELETQIEALQIKIRDCEPCDPSPSGVIAESVHEVAARENAARRELLLALGLDDESQQRFIASAAKRQSVFTVLQQDALDTAQSQTDSPGHDSKRSETAALPNGIATTGAMDFATGEMPELIEYITPEGNESVDYNNNATFEPLLEDENWLFAPETLENLSALSQVAPIDIPWLDTISYGNDHRSLLSSSIGPSNTALQLDSIPNIGAAQVAIKAAAPSDDILSHDDTAMRCFLDTVIRFEPGDSATVCSRALSMIFQHNRKGLSMSELQRRLSPGIVKPDGPASECKIMNSVLFRVLASVSSE